MTTIIEPVIKNSNQYQKDIGKLFKVMQEKYPNNVIIPCSSHKAPLYPHKDGAYTWNTIVDKNIQFADNGQIGVILKDLIVLDIDNQIEAKTMEDKFPFLKDVVSEFTTKGKHYYFKRTTLCDKLGIYDLSRCIFDEDGVTKKEVDCKTIATTGTGGIIIIAPSPNKKWLNSIYDNDITAIPDDLVKYLKKNWSFCDKRQLEKTKTEKKKDDTQAIIDKFKGIYKEELNEGIDVNLLKGLLDIIKHIMNVNYCDWIKVGWSLFNITKGSPTGLELWNDFSKSSKKYVDNCCEEHWYKMKYNKNGYSEGSLRWWAKDIDEKAYNGVLKNHLKYYILCSLSGHDLDLANVIYQLLKKEYIIFNSPEGKRIGCWRFHNHKWVPDGMNYLKKYITTEIIHIYHDLALWYDNEAKLCIEDDETKALDLIALSKEIDKASKHFKSSGKLRSIIDMLGTFMSEDYDDFNEKINENPDLIGFANGVYDLSEMVFREGRPSDYITFSTKYDYVEEDDIEIQDAIKNILWGSSERDDIYKFNLDIASYCLTGKKTLEIYSIWCGDGGRGGKGVNAKLSAYTFGDYYREVKANNFTDPNDAKGSTDSEIVQLKGVRMVVSTEPAKNAKLQLNRIKEWTGGDLIKARALFKESIQFQCQFYIIIQANHFPVNSSNKDRANEKRVKAVPWKLEFVDTPTTENERPVNTNIKNLFKNNIKYRQQYMRMLIQNYKTIYDSEKDSFNIKTPKVIQDTTKLLLNMNNEFMLWFGDNYQKTNNSKDYVKKYAMYCVYKQDYPNSKKNTFYRYMEENGFKVSSLDGQEIYRNVTMLSDNNNAMDNLMRKV